MAGRQVRISHTTLEIKLGKNIRDDGIITSQRTGIKELMKYTGTRDTITLRGLFGASSNITASRTNMKSQSSSNAQALIDLGKGIDAQTNVLNSIDFTTPGAKLTADTALQSAADAKAAGALADAGAIPEMKNTISGMREAARPPQALLERAAARAANGLKAQKDAIGHNSGRVAAGLARDGANGRRTNAGGARKFASNAASAFDAMARGVNIDGARSAVEGARTTHDATIANLTRTDRAAVERASANRAASFKEFGARNAEALAATALRAGADGDFTQNAPSLVKKAGEIVDTLIAIRDASTREGNATLDITNGTNQQGAGQES
jgi:hypothetical protein